MKGRLKLGDKVRKNIQWSDFGGKRGRDRITKKEAVVKVVYIHPRGRFYTLEFEFLGGSYKESYS